MISFSEYLEEIRKLNKTDYSGGKSALGSEKAPSRAKPLPGGSGYKYLVKKGRIQLTVNIYDPENNGEIIAQLNASPLGKNFPLDNALTVDTITVDEKYRGGGLAKALYGIILSILKFPLVAGGSQTPGGRKNWVSLSKIPGVELFGYMKIHDKAFDNDSNYFTKKSSADVTIDTLMRKLGAQYIGKINKDRWSSSDIHFFSFDVSPNTSEKELKSTVNTELSKVYDNDSIAFDVGLYAVWTGK